jgi:glycosyltransferase involved in cell wall biosynthesis
MHVVSSGGIADAMQPSLFMPLTTKLPKQKVKVQVVSLSPGSVRAPILRQNGVPVHDVAFSRTRFAMNGFSELMNAVHSFRPDVIQAWGHTAQLVSITVRKKCDWSPSVIWSVVETAPLAKDAGFVDRQKLKLVAKSAERVDRIVYASEAGAAHHRRAGFPESGYACIAPGVDAVRFKPDPGARPKVRERLQVPHDAFVIGMVAPFQPEYDHATFLKGVAELIKTHPNIYVLLAGHGVQRGNASLIAMIGSGALSHRIQLLGEWSDLTSLFNACDLVCSSALTDAARMTLAMAMLCGIPCVATGLGAQGELIGQHGVAIEPGNPAAFVRGIGKILQMTPDKRHQLAQSARKHALQNYVYVRSLQKYLQLYGELVGKEAIAQAVIPAPAVDVNEPLPPKVEIAPPPKKPEVVIEQLSDPDSLESRVAAVEPESLPKWRIEQEQARKEQDARWSSTKSSDGDVLQIFEAELASKPASATVTPMSERARGFVEDFEELLPVEVLTAPAEPSADAKAAAPSAQQPESAPQPVKDGGAASMAVAPAMSPTTSNVEPRSVEPPVSSGSEATRPALAVSKGAVDQGASAESMSKDSKASSDAVNLAPTQSASSSIVDTNATLPPTKTLETLEASAQTSPESLAAPDGPEPVQVSLFDFELAPEPGAPEPEERKVVSG